MTGTDVSPGRNPIIVVNVLNMEASSYVGQAFRPACSKAKALPYTDDSEH